MTAFDLCFIIPICLALGYKLRQWHAIDEWVDGYRCGYHAGKSGDEWECEDEMHR